MDAKITKQRLSRLLSYDWIKIIGIAVGAIVLWSLIFTMTATRITPSQQFTVFNHYANVAFDYSSFYDTYDTTIERNVFSYEILETDAIDLATAGDDYYTMCDTRFTTGQGDLMFIPNIPDKDTAITTTDDAGESTITYTHTYPESFLNRYFTFIISWDEYLEDGKAYLVSYYGEDYANGELNKAKAERDFRARINKNKDKRFKRESQIEKGVEEEYERLEKYRDAFVQFESYLASDAIRLEYVAVTDEKGEPMVDEQGNVLYDGNYILNLSPDGKNTKLTNTVYYSKVLEDGTKISCSDDMCVMLFLLPDMDDDYLCEVLLYLNTVIEGSLPTQTA